LELIIKTDKVSAYYHHPLTKCSINHHKKEITMVPTIPIRPVHTTYKVIESISIPFLHKSKQGEGQICRIDNVHHLVVEESQLGTTVTPIDSAQLPNCRIDTGICLFSEFGTTPRT
jgi:hypothetical protein